MKNNTFLSENVNEIPFESDAVSDPSGIFVPEDALNNMPPNSKTRGQRVLVGYVL